MGVGVRCHSHIDIGSVNLYELSFDEAVDLNQYQPSAFTLVTITFDAIGTGITSLTMDINPFGDAWGDPLTIDSIGEGNITVAAPVPEPATMLLFGTGLAGLVTTLRRKNKK